MIIHNGELNTHCSIISGNKHLLNNVFVLSLPTVVNFTSLLIPLKILGYFHKSNQKCCDTQLSVWINMGKSNENQIEWLINGKSQTKKSCMARLSPSGLCIVSYIQINRLWSATFIISIMDPLSFQFCYFLT